MKQLDIPIANKLRIVHVTRPERSNAGEPLRREAFTDGNRILRGGTCGIDAAGPLQDKSNRRILFQAHALSISIQKSETEATKG